MSVQQVRPSRVWYWVAAALGVASIVWVVLILVIGFNSLGRQIDGFQQVPIPGQSEVSFTEPGSYVLYYEGLGASEGNVPQFNVTLTPVDGNSAVRLSNYEGSLTYNVSGHSGRALGTIEVDEPGRYVLLTESATAAGGQAIAAVGESVGGDIVRTVVLGTVGAMVLFFAGVALAVVVAIRRRRARRVLLAAGADTPFDSREGESGGRSPQAG